MHHSGIQLAVRYQIAVYMELVGKKNKEHEENQVWENPVNPEAPTDARDEEQMERQHQEAERLKNGLAETDDEPNKKK